MEKEMLDDRMDRKTEKKEANVGSLGIPVNTFEQVPSIRKVWRAKFPKAIKRFYKSHLHDFVIEGKGKRSISHANYKLY